MSHYGSFKWEDEYDEWYKLHFYDDVFRKGSIKDICINYMFLSIGFMLTTGMMLFGLLVQSAFSGVVSLVGGGIIIPGITLTVIALGLVLLDVGDGEGGITKFLLSSVFLPIYIVIELIRMAKGYMKFKKNIKKFHNLTDEYKACRTFSEGKSGVYQLLNTEIELQNGYITYLNNIMNGNKEGVTVNTENYRELSHSNEDTKKKLIVDGNKINEANIGNFLNGLREDYELDSEYNKSLEKQQKLEKDEEQRLSNIRYIQENLEKNREKRQDNKDYLTDENRKNTVNKMEEEINQSLMDLKRKIKD